MKLYPEAVHARTRAIAKDVLLAVVLIALAWLGLRVYHAVDRLTVLGSGVEQAGTSVNQGFHTAADAVKGVPLVGHKLSSALGGAGQKTGGNVAHYGERGQQEVHKRPGPRTTDLRPPRCDRAAVLPAAAHPTRAGPRRILQGPHAPR